MRRSAAQVGTRLLAPVALGAIVALVAVLAAAAVVVGVRLASRPAPAGPPPGTPLDASAVRGTHATTPIGTPTPLSAPPSAPASAQPSAGPAAVAGATRLDLVLPSAVVDTRGALPLQAGEAAPLVLAPDAVSGATATLLEVSIVDAVAPGEVNVSSTAGTITALRVPAPGAMTSATVVMPVGPDGSLEVTTAGGGHLVVRLLGAFRPTATATGGRIVTVPATRVVDLVPETDGKVATIDPAKVPALAGAGPVAAVVLQIAADVGDRGGRVSAGPVGGAADQDVFWSPTSGDDRVRHGLLVAQLRGGAVQLEYQAGREMRVDLVGYVTGPGAPESMSGLVVPVTARPLPPVTVPPEGMAQASVLAGSAVPAQRVTGALVLVGAVGTGGVTVSPPGSADGDAVTVTASPAGPRAVLALVGTPAGGVQVSAGAGADVTLTPEALVVE